MAIYYEKGEKVKFLNLSTMAWETAEYICYSDVLYGHVLRTEYIIDEGFTLPFITVCDKYVKPLIVDLNNPNDSFRSTKERET